MAFEQCLPLIAKVDRIKGIRLLSESLELPCFSDDLQKKIYIDCIYDAAVSTIKHGMSWTEASHLLEMFKQIIDESIGGTLIETVKICDQFTSQYASIVSVDCLRFMTEYIATTFLQHFRLYQHVFQHKQDRLVIKLQESVSIPPSLPSFTGSIPRDIWEYEAKQRVLDEQEEQRKQCDEVKQLQVRESDQETMKQAYIGLQDQPAETFDRQRVLDIIEQAVKAHLTAAEHRLQHSVVNSVADTTYKLDKTAMPRPQQLGPPPRYSLNAKPTTPGNKSKAGDQKPGGRKSARSRPGTKTEG